MYFIQFLVEEYLWAEPIDLETYISYEYNRKIIEITFNATSTVFQIYKRIKYKQVIRICKNDTLTTFGDIIVIEPNCSDEYIKDVVFPKLEMMINQIKTYIALEKME